MFVSISLSSETITRVDEINRIYAEDHPVEVLA